LLGHGVGAFVSKSVIELFNGVRGDGVGRVIGITVIGHIIRKSSLTLSATLAVNCINGCDGGLLEVGAVVWDQWEA